MPICDVQRLKMTLIGARHPARVIGLKPLEIAHDISR